MTGAISTESRRWFVPEVIQSSMMDCGPASLKALFEGFGIPIHYSRLREACQTDLDGTSIDVIEDVAVKLGLAAEQFIVPIDHLLLPEAEALPAMVVTQLPNGFTHFVVTWRTHRHLVQIMDPGAGRLFRTPSRFLKDVYVHRFPATGELAYQWLTAPAFIAPLSRRMADLGFFLGDIDDLLKAAQATDDWLPIAALDAATRMATRLVRSGAMKPGFVAISLVKRMAALAAKGGIAAALELLPSQYWSVGALPDGNVELRGAVLLHVAGKTPPAAPEDEPREIPTSPELAAAIGADNTKPIQSILAAAFAEYRMGLFAVPLAMLLAGAGTGIEAFLFSSLSSADHASGSRLDSVRALWGLSAFLVITLLLNLSASAVLLRLGRWLDLHLRIRLLEKLPRLGTYYFHSRLKSDLVQRAHQLRSLRQMPLLVADGLAVVSEIVLTAAGLVWLLPGNAIPVVLAAFTMVGLPLVTFPLMREQDLRRETHTGVILRFHLDALLGLMPIKAHRAKDAMRAEHEGMLVKWAAASRELAWTYVGGLGVGLVSSTLFAVWALDHAMDHEGRNEFKLLIVYWIMKLPTLSQSLANVVRQLPWMENRFIRLFDVLSGPEETEAYAYRGNTPKIEPAFSPAASRDGVFVVMHDVQVQAGGHPILSDVNLEIQPGEHIAVVGPSGSGKTSLVGLLLGWHRAHAGSVYVDGELLQAEQIQRLRRETAWVDPAIEIWNRSFDQNIRYGNGDISAKDIRSAIESADLVDVIDRLPQGVESNLGEGGGMVSGGEGQRVRFARAMARPGVRLVILDEPFRGLDHDKRCELLAAARQKWSAATLIYVSHDIDTALDFPRVLVIENGHIVENGAPNELLERADSRLGALKAAREALQDEIWHNPIWRRWSMERGELRELDKESP